MKATNECGDLLMSMNESDTRAKLIDPALHVVGWHEDMIKREETAAPIVLTDNGPKRKDKGRVDYLLRVKVDQGTQPVALAVIEAKSEDKMPSFGLEQAKNYCRRLNVRFAFSSNGHHFVEYDSFLGKTTNPQLLKFFPTPEQLTKRYESSMGIKLNDPKAKPLATPYAKGEAGRRYYIDAAIRAVFEKFAQGENRALLSLATGTGKTLIAVNILKRIADAGQLRRALFLCDRDELRTQANGALRKEFGNDVAEVTSGNPQKTAKILVATYQTLDVDTDDSNANFLKDNYPENYFSHIIIDECHRSAWNKWFEVLERNKGALQVGLTATPREIDVKEETEDTKKDKQILADNFKYFGEPVYEYSITQAMEDGYLAVCELIKRDIFLERNIDNEKITGITKEELEGKELKNANTQESISPEQLEKTKYIAPNFEDQITIPERIQAMCKDFFNQLLILNNGNPEQKSIIFCVRDYHADEVASKMNNLYADWCKENSKRVADPYAFKCTAASQGSKHISELRGQNNSHFIATTVELLSTGVDVPCVRNIVFFRYVNSPISFTQMVGRGTRLHPETDKLMFRIFDYTNASRLFGESFRTNLAKEQKKQSESHKEDVIEVSGVEVHVNDAGRYIITEKDGKPTPVTVDEYKGMIAEKLVEQAPTLDVFRAKWIEPKLREELLDKLPENGRAALVIRDLEDMKDYDLYDVLAELGYGLNPLNRVARSLMFNVKNRAWLESLPQKTAQTLLALVKQFEKNGITELETTTLFQIQEVKLAGGLEALKVLGQPGQIITTTKQRLFAA